MKESSEVLARKYRPSNFEELIGQESIAQTLSLALDSKRLSHAYLFSGLRGSGKTSTARIFAKALICERGVTHQPCGVCENCTLALQNRHMDIVEMDAASSRKIDDIRDLIEQTKYRPASARFKIFIIDEVHMLTKEAFNALLKTLEEPPEYVKFILATTDPLKLPATILSRTQHFRFKSIATNKIIDHLAHILNLEGIGYDHEALEILARSGSGSLRDTLTLLDQAIIYSKGHV
ncbi:MAG: DNA polymerase III subunit gamma/tau, partial [Thiovulaceae bacterium]|nr:DNA polymerase III subunit gamma/tau [Sulfurimonadaceae bacterium]